MAIGTTMAILGAAAIGGAASLAAGAMQSNAAQQAANTQAAAADKALELQRQQHDQARQDSMPWMNAGKTALNAYMGELGLSDEAKAGTFQSGFKTTPGYEFAVQEGEKGAINNLAALGMKNSGAALKALTRFRTGLADQTYNNYLDRLSAASTGGQAQVSQNNALGAQYAQTAGQTLQDKGAATASGYVGGANAWSNALSNLSNNAGWALGMGSNNFGKGFGFNFGAA
jgi:hypothetical protein